MEHIKIHIDDEEEKLSNSTSYDGERDEEKWTDKNEKFFLDIKNKCLIQSDLHSKASHKNKKRFIYSSIPSTILPIIIANLNFIDIDYQNYFNPIGLSVVSIINGISTLLNFSKKTEVHNVYAGKYAELAGEIDKILIRKKKHRNAFDVVLEQITTKFNNLNNEAPYL